MAYIGNKPANKAVVAGDLDPAVITGQTALAEAPASTDEFLISDAGVLKRLDASHIGGTNTPIFRATVSGTQAIPNATSTKVDFDTEVFDPQSTYDHSTNQRWTPGVAGYVFVGAKIRSAIDNDFNYFQVRIFKNGSAISIANASHFDTESKEINIIDLADDDDYYEAYAYHNKGTSENLRSNTSEMQFFGYKLIT